MLAVVLLLFSTCDDNFFCFIFAGRMFEGSASTMLSSLTKVADLPEDTLVWPGKVVGQVDQVYSSASP